MIKSDNGTTELRGNSIQVLCELSAIIYGICHSMTEEHRKTREEARAWVLLAVWQGLTVEADEPEAAKEDTKADDGLAKTFRMLCDSLKVGIGSVGARDDNVGRCRCAEQYGECNE